MVLPVFNEQTMVAEKLTPLQLELLKVYALHPSEEDLLAVKRLLAEYFSSKLTSRVEQAVREKGITEGDLEQWLNE